MKGHNNSNQHQQQPIINNLTNINIINYNNYDSNNPNANANAKANNTNTEKFLHQQQNINNKINSHNNFETEKFANKTFHNSNFNPNDKKQNSLINSNKYLPNKNMVLTSYNFNQNLKDNILSLYTSTTFDKNFKTFYKGDPYNFDIDNNYNMQKSK